MLKLITLNTWGGGVGEPLLEFVRTHDPKVHIWCMQELYQDAEPLLGTEYPENRMNLYSDIKYLTPESFGFFRPVIGGVYGIGMFVQKHFAVLGEGEIEIAPNRSNAGEIDGLHARNLQWVRMVTANKEFVVINVHGLWNGNGKSDTPDRIEQSKRICAFLGQIHHPVVLCGDFNLEPNTESIKIIENAGMRNLVVEHGVQSTRSSHYDKPIKHADYIFVSKGITVHDFKVMPDEVSDHLPLYLEFDVGASRA